MKPRPPVGMKSTRVPWSTKLRPAMTPTVVNDPRTPGRLLLPTPLLIADEISQIEKGALLTMSELRERLARRFQADRTCPLMAGIFFNIVAGATEEAIAAGQRPLAPYWRIIRDNGALSPKTPAGDERQAEHLRLEGHTVQSRRGTLIVASHEPVRPAKSARGKHPSPRGAKATALPRKP